MIRRLSALAARLRVSRNTRHESQQPRQQAVTFGCGVRWLSITGVIAVCQEHRDGAHWWRDWEDERRYAFVDDNYLRLPGVRVP